jgi:hypothetical protein
MRSSYSLSSPKLLGLARAVLGCGVSFRFRATGQSMSPFIRSGDVLTIAPLSGRPPRIGEVVAFVHPVTGKLAVHRVVRARDAARLLRGDATLEADGWVRPEDILGRVTAIERNGRHVRFGLGMERVGIAWLRRHDALWKLARAAKRAVSGRKWAD